MIGDDFLDFAGIEPRRMRLYPVETHVAEKLHAYTLPRTRPNSRVKDLPDLALLAAIRPIEARVLRRAIDQTFTLRGTHAPPSALPSPPPEWAPAYERMAAEDALTWPTLADVARAAETFLGPVLAGATTATWNPVTRSWA